MKMDSELLLFSIFYVFCAGIFIFPPNEFVSAGCTIEYLCSKWLGSEYDRFIQYHIRRVVFTMACHSLLPLGYTLGVSWLLQRDPLTMFIRGDITWKLFVVASFSIPLYVAYKVNKWYYDQWKTHPIAQKLAKFSNFNTSWLTVASDINLEFRRFDKISLHLSSVTRVVATDNWVVKLTPYGLCVAHQSDTALILSSSDSHQVAPNNPGGAQFLTIDVRSTRAGVPSFQIRLNALDFKDLQDKLSRPITVLNNVKFHRTLTDRFLEAFHEQVNQNPLFDTVQELEPCMGCMVAASSVKLQKLCEDPACVSCFCRPMWCLDCMGKWFASRQDQDRPETWLASRCTCPVCRSNFCIRDICSVQTDNQPE